MTARRITVQLERMASTALNFASTNLFLTHFAGDWAKEMLSPITEQLTPETPQSSHS